MFKAVFALHFLSLLCYSAIFSSVGPLIPYFSDEAARPQSYFSIILIMRGAGFVLGGFLKLWLMRSLNLHRGLAIGCFLTGAGSLVINFSYHIVWIACCSLIIAVGLFLIEVLASVSIMAEAGEQKGVYLRMGYTFASLGNFLEAWLISWVGLEILMIFGNTLLMMSLSYLLLPPEGGQEGKPQANNPEKEKTDNQKAIGSENVNPMER